MVRAMLSRSKRPCVLPGLLLAFWGMAPTQAAEPTVRPVGNESQQATWVESLRLIQSGAFDTAAQQIETMLTSGVRDERVRRVESWLNEWCKEQRERKLRTTGDYVRYVEWVKEDLAGAERDGKLGWWRLAILDSARAHACAPDREAMLKEPWFVTVRDGAAQTARDHEAKSEWLKAARIWAPLFDMFPANREYRLAFEKCQAHLRLELFYGEDPEWQNTVKNITPDMATDAFRKIEDVYLVRPSFKDASAAGLEQLTRLARMGKLAKVLPGLGEPEKVAEFCDRLEVRLNQVRQAEDMNAEDMIDLFERLLRINGEVRLVPENVLIHEFVHGCLQPLDKFSDVLWPTDVPEFNKHTQGRFSGVGIQIRKEEPGKPLLVVSPLEDTPAYLAGIQPGDLITRINGSPTDKITVAQAVREITGPAETTVVLDIRRPGVDKEFTVQLRRQEITVYTIKGHQRDERGQWQFLIDAREKISYVRMTNFTEGTIDELRAVIRRLREQEGMRGLIFDLRGNPGGPLKSAVEVSELFLENSKRIVSTRDRDGQPWEKSSGSNEHFTDFPIIVVVDDTTASASEIVSGALQVHKRALILGERTYGKGSVQQVLPLNRGNAALLKLTTAHYYLPNGRCLHREDDSTTWGVDPDVTVRLVPKEYVKLRELQLRRDILRGRTPQEPPQTDLPAGASLRPQQKPEADAESPDADATEADADDPEVKRDDDNGFPAADPQVEAALMLMRIRLKSEIDWSAGPEQVVAVPVSETRRTAPTVGGAAN